MFPTVEWKNGTAKLIDQTLLPRKYKIITIRTPQQMWHAIKRLSVRGAPAIGIGRTHFEAASLMLEAMIHGNFGIQNSIEREITNRINESNVGPLGLKGNTTALASFLRVGPQRASGVRIVCLRLCCCVEPRVANVLL